MQQSLPGKLSEMAPQVSEEQVLAFVRSRLSRRFDIRKIVLFGSRARRTSTADSDWDVFVVANSDLPFIERQGIALLDLGKRPFSIDLLVYTPEEAAVAAAIPGSAVYWAEREGRQLFAQ